VEETVGRQDGEIFLFGLLHSEIDNVLREIEHLVSVNSRAHNNSRIEEDLLK